MTTADMTTDRPRCYLCDSPSSRRVTRSSNRNGNAGRPYFKCVPCDKFLVFADARGNDHENPVCLCRVASKRQVAGRDRQVPRCLHYVCRLGRCGFFARARDVEGKAVTVDEEMIETLARLSII
ncbi:hypothetical protein F4778DRAFT_802559 [Xylariomycetidae sp. FL2044]|nr:hypothetical protein F4778DRAFT_802559 [Xylariomycetidae sp. FL2044]